jgi:hypothetical protein
MNMVYRVLAYLVAAEVVVQAMVIVFAIAGLGKWVEDGGVFDKAMIDSEETPFPEGVGFTIHSINGMIILPLTGLLLLIFAFFTRITRAARWAGLVLLLIVVQVALGLFGHEVPALGALHGLNALALFSVAVYAARRQGVATQPEARVPTPV